MARKPLFRQEGAMARTTIAVPERWLIIARNMGINVSDVARAALRAEIERLRAAVRARRGGKP